MDIQVKNYIFNKTEKTVTFTDYTSIRLDSIRFISNATTGVLIYSNPHDVGSNLGGTVLNNVLTLEADTSTMLDTHGLLIAYSDSDTMGDLIRVLQELISRLEPIASAMNSGQPALRTIPIGSVSTAVTGTVTATVASTVVSSLTNFGTGIPASEMAHDINNTTVILGNINNTIGK